MRLDLNQLPNDVVLLQRLVRDLSDHLEEQHSSLSQAQDALRTSQRELQAKAERIAWLEQQLAKLRHARFGRSSEKLSADQLALWQAEQDASIAEAERALAAETGQVLDAPTPATVSAPPTRQRLPAHLPREEHTHTAAACACGGILTEIGEETVEQLDWRPAAFFVRRHTKKKYACAACQSALTAALPPQPIDKGLPGPGLLAQVITAKFCDHLPLYRQSEIYARDGVTLARSTLSGWLGECAWWLRPLVSLMREDLLGESVLHTDDTIVPVLDPGRGKTRQGRLWVYLRDTRFGAPCAVYDYTPTRNKDGPQRWLAPLQGYLQADEYPGYEGLYARGAITAVGCWSHARRKFTDIEKAGPSPLARAALVRIGELFAIERRLDEANATFEQRRKVRQREALPKLAAFKAWLDEQLLGLSRKSALANAIAYLTKRWPSFTVYTTDGRLLMHNNPAENALRAVVLGRKNYLCVSRRRTNDENITLAA